MKRALAFVVLAAACGVQHPPHRAPSAARVSTTSSTTSTTTTTVAPSTTTVLPTTTSSLPVSPPVRSVPVGDDLRCPASVRDAIHRHFDQFGVDVGSRMTQIAWRESNCRPDVVSPTSCYSYLQLALPLHADLYAAAGYPDWYASRFDGEANLAAAALLFRAAGWSPWAL